MSQSAHTYGPTCHLARSVTFSGTNSDDDMPDLKAQYFYSSQLPIDDPLSAAPTPSGSESKSVKHPPRPFSAYDNNALEEAWLGLGNEKDRKVHNKGKQTKASRPLRNDRPGSSIGTLSAGKQKKVPLEDSVKRPDVNSAAAQASTSSVSQITKRVKISSFSADAARDEVPPPASKRSGKAKKTELVPGTSGNEVKSALGKLAKKSASDGETGQKIEASDTLHNRNCNDPDHLILEVDIAPGDTPGCCSDFEKTGHAESKSQHSRAEEDSPKNANGNGKQGASIESQKNQSQKDKKEKQMESASTSRKMGPCQGDATDEAFLTKVACSFKECDSSKPPAKDTARCDLSSKEHAMLEKHENSKVHQDFEKHSQAKHTDGQTSKSDTKPKPTEKNAKPPLQDKKPGLQLSEPADKKSKPSEKNTKLSPQDKESDIKPSEPANKLLKLFEKKSTHVSQDEKPDAQTSEPAGKKKTLFEKKPYPAPQDKKGSPSHDRQPDVQNPEPSQKKLKQSDKIATPLPSSQLSELTTHPDQGNDAGTTGRPFLKLPSRPTSPQLPVLDGPPHEGENNGSQDDQCAEDSYRKRSERDSTETESLPDHKCKAHKSTKEHVDVPVGVSRLHKVVLPTLQMEPIYWSPVHDIAPVTRGTWFYKDTMYPVEPPVANQLETGYRGLRPWSQTWKDELRSANEVGAAGEEKVAHHLWPRDEDKRSTSDDIVSIDPYCAAKCFRGEAAAEGAIDIDDTEKKSSDASSIVKKYPNAQVIYKDSKNAYILKPNLHPSAYHKRRPLQKIQKSLTVGIHVVRGFDWKDWEKLHPSKKSNAATKVDEHVAVSGDSDLGKRNACVACRSQEERKECTDLVLVVHGIGQKLSERVESFNFTHAINAFRRCVNVELCNEAVQKVLRDDLGGVMVLPVNWRSNVSFDDGDTMKDGDNDRSGSNFSLKDITPPTIPAVRSLISDVMLDIPYYMSKNKPKMIEAVTNEANRVYRLWCKNNPEFHKNGRVHIIAHSLGSAMAIEILSKQPTLVPKVDFMGKKINSKYFDFNTTNLFCAGSPAGFFLLLEKGKLVPRKGQSKPGAEAGDDKDKSIVGDPGSFGCLAVDNIYNIMHQNDPIAYRLNACTDPQYAASLKTAYVPSATTGFFETIGNAMKLITPGVAAPTDLAVGQMAKPTAIARLPSQLEMDVHNFTAEERAEKKFYLLNDNCQVDYVLTSGGGPLEIQYLNMLGAHSSYWTNPDFIRMLVIEVGRKAGRQFCLPNMKAVKARQKA